MEKYVRRNSEEKIEFRFYGLSGSASGRVTPWILAGLAIMAIIAIIFLATKVGGILFASTWAARIRGP